MKIAKTHSECWLLAALLMATPASAQTPKQPARTPTPAPPDRVEAYARFRGLLFDNFFQAPDGSPEEDVAGATFEGGLSLALQERRPLRAYAEGDYTHDCRDIMLADENGFVPYAARDEHPQAQKTWRATHLPPLF